MEKKSPHAQSFAHAVKHLPPKRQQSGSLNVRLEPILNRSKWIDPKDWRQSINEAEADTVSEETTISLPLTVCKKEELIRFFRSELGDRNQLFDLIIQDDEKKLERKCNAGLSQLELNIGLLLAAYYDKVKAIVSFVNNGADCNFHDKLGRSALHFAALAESQACIKVLINSGANVNSWDLERTSTPLFCAAATGSFSCVKLLLQNKADLYACAEPGAPTVLFHAIRANSEECVRYLIDQGAEINSKVAYSETALHVAASEGNVGCMRILLEKGADIRAVKGTLKSTPLHLSVEDGSVECATVLLDRGANPDVRNSKQQTPLHIAALHQSHKCIETLLIVGADPNARDIDKRTPLHNAIVKGSKNFDCVKLLLENGADPNVQDVFGFTPVHLAALNEYSECVVLLMEYNVDLTAKTNGGLSVFNFMVRKTPDALSKLTEIFDNSINYCNDLGSRDSEIRIDFRSLVCPSRHSETGLLECIVNEGQKDFLKHPLCESFLHLKWLKIRKYFLLHLFFYVVFITILTLYIMNTFGNQCFVPELSSNCTELDTAEKRNDYLNSMHIQALQILLIISVVNITLKELIQLSVEPARYWKKVDNWLLWIITILVCLLLHLFETDGFIAPWQFHIAASSLILSWVVLMLLIGRFPNLGLYVQMFTIVTFDLGKFLVAYCSLIIAFTLSFSILLHNEAAFANAYQGIITTIVMMTGELDYNDKFFDQYKITYPGTTEVIFFAFLLLVSIVLMNLMVGLAVNDIQGLQKSARLERLVRLTMLVSHVENILFSGWLNFLPEKVLKFIQNEAVVVPSCYHWVLYLRPNDPRDKRIPKEIVAKASYIIKARRKKIPTSKKLLNRIISDYSYKTTDTYPDRITDIEDDPSCIQTTINKLIADHDILEDQLSTLDDKVDMSERILSSMDQKMRVLTETTAEYSKQLKNFEDQIMGLQGTLKTFVDAFNTYQGDA